MTGRLPSVATATKTAIKAARDGDRIRPWHEPYVAIALRLASSLQPTKLAIGELIRLTSELDKALSRLPLAETTEPDGGGAGDGPGSAAGSAGQNGARPVGLAARVGSGPEVGDTALPG